MAKGKSLGPAFQGGITCAAVADAIALASGRAAEWKAQGLPAAEIDRRLRYAIVACAGPEVDSATAVFQLVRSMGGFAEPIVAPNGRGPLQRRRAARRKLHR